jgi:hypothetical protein
MNDEIYELKQKDLENQRLLKNGASELANFNQKFEELKSSKKQSVIEFYDERIKLMSNNSSDLKIKLLITEAEAAKLLVELEDYKGKFEKTKRLSDLNLQAKQIEINQLDREKEALSKKLIDHDLALAIAEDKITELQKKITSFYDLDLYDLYLVMDEIHLLNSDLLVKKKNTFFDNKIHNFFGKSYMTFSNLGKISLLFIIIFYSSKIFLKFLNLAKSLFFSKEEKI